MAPRTKLARPGNPTVVPTSSGIRSIEEGNLTLAAFTSDADDNTMDGNNAGPSMIVYDVRISILPFPDYFH